MLDIRSVDGVPDARELTTWSELVAVDPDATIFHTPRFLRAWSAVLGDRVEPRLKWLSRDGAVVGVVPEELEDVGSSDRPVRELRFLGGTEVTDYVGPVAVPADRGAVAQAWTASLLDDPAWDRVVAAGLPEDTGWASLIEQHARSVGLSVQTETEDVCPRVDIADGPDAWLDSLGSKERHELQRKARKLARELGGLEVVTAPPDDALGALGSFLDLASQASGAKGRFFVDDRMRRFFGALVEEFAPDGTLRIDRLVVAGQTAAATVSLLHRGVFSLYNSSFDQGLGTYAPGMVLVTELVQDAARSGCATFDLLRGDEPYKYRFGATERRLVRLTLTRS
ncbi:MAG: GNAT family N-acetyltransferase [Actinobacteria bacterium]|nr:GNAT family N-acetyltransferase [Actinomycetota bacterium]